MAWRVVRDGATGMGKAVLGEPGGPMVEIHLHGGHVTSWKNKEGEDLIFLSPRAISKPAETIRGGIQVCFPQFSGSGALEQQHGFASSRMWQIDPKPPPAPLRPSANTGPIKPYVDLVLQPNRADLRVWPHYFSLRQRITLGPSGELTSDIRIDNHGFRPFTFTFALLNYLPVSDIDNVRVAGLATFDFLDSLKKYKRKKEKDVSITFIKKVDRTYLETPAEIAITDLEKHQMFVLKKDESLPDIVVWNPSRKKKLARLKARLKSWLKPNGGDDECRDEYKFMLCVGAAAAERAITLQPGEQWTASQEISPVYYFGQQDLRRS